MTGDERCDDGNTLNGDCCSSACQFETGSCDDGNACTTADGCSRGTCVGGPPPNCDDGDVCNGTETCNPTSGCKAGTPLGLEAVAGSLTGASQTPDACTGTKDLQLSRKLTKLIASAQKKLSKAAQATKERKQQKLTKDAVRQVDKARTKTNKLSPNLSPECRDAVIGQVGVAEGQVGCVQ